ncbi:MAG: metal-sulfur cluster assembly factor [Clostridia bacterium]|nr:metal-sulfur cluster assembly factor [Clostridia bacterium]
MEGEGWRRPAAADERLLAALWEALRDVFDPELGYNVVDLGLVYGLEAGEGRVRVVMTMTTPGCPAGDMIEDGVRQRLLQVPGVEQVEVRVVWSPPWTPEMMSDDAKRYFGIA